MTVSCVCVVGVWFVTRTRKKVSTSVVTKALKVSCIPTRKAVRTWGLQLWAWKDTLDLGYQLQGSLNLSPPVTEKAHFRK